MFRASIVEKGGAKFEGIQKNDGQDMFVVATDPQTRSTYYFPIKGLTKKKVKERLIEERKKFKV